MSTGEGKGREEDKCTIYKRNTSTSYNLKLKGYYYYYYHFFNFHFISFHFILLASRAVFGEIIKKFPAMPFTLRALEDKKSKLGIVECVTHDLLQPFPVLYEKEGNLILIFFFFSYCFFLFFLFSFSNNKKMQMQKKKKN